MTGEAPGRLPRVAPLCRGAGLRCRSSLRAAGGDAAGAGAGAGVLAPAAARLEWRKSVFFFLMFLLGLLTVYLYAFI